MEAQTAERRGEEVHVSMRRQARAARAQLERVLDVLSWPWDAAISLLIDRALIEEERAT